MDLSALLNCGFFPFFFSRQVYLGDSWRESVSRSILVPQELFFSQRRKAKVKPVKRQNQRKTQWFPTMFWERNYQEENLTKSPKKWVKKKNKEIIKQESALWRRSCPFFFLTQASCEDTGGLFFLSGWGPCFEVSSSHTHKKKTVKWGEGQPLRKNPTRQLFLLV